MFTEENNDFRDYGMTKEEVYREYEIAKEKAKDNPDYHQISRACYLFWQTGICHCICCCKPQDLCVYAEP